MNTQLPGRPAGRPDGRPPSRAPPEHSDCGASDVLAIFYPPLK